MTTLNTYEVQVADLLHDPNNQIWTVTQLDLYINEARRQLVMDTGCLRTLQQSYVTAGQEAYTFGQVSGAIVATPGTGYTSPAVTFSGGGGTGVAATLSQSAGAVNAVTFTNFGSGYTSAPTATVTDGGPGVGATVTTGVVNYNTFDILDIHVVWGSERYSLLWKPFSWFSANMRLWLAASYQRQPAMWAVYGENQFYLGPPPDQTYAIEIDSIILPTPLADYVTVDPIPVRNQDPIKFYAAYLAKFNNQNYGEAEVMLDAYQRRMREVSTAYTRRIANPYGP